MPDTLGIFWMSDAPAVGLGQHGFQRCDLFEPGVVGVYESILLAQAHESEVI